MSQVGNTLRTGRAVPELGTPVPPTVKELASGAAVVPVWRNECGGLTFRTVEPSERYIKWQSLEGLSARQYADVDLVLEAEKLRWAGNFTPVPRVLDVGSGGGEAWLVTERLDGTTAFDAYWRERPETAVSAIATGLRRWHDALPVAECPYRGSWVSADARAPEPDRLVVCHGDACVPNTLLHADGSWAGHVDLARLGVADRWADLAIATYSISWDVNFGRNYDALFFEVYGVELDAERIQFYRAQWDAA